MTDTLVIAGYGGDGLPTLTVSTTSGVFLAPEFSFGDLVLSGSLFDRYADKQITLPLVVKSTTRASMRALVEQTTMALSRAFFILTWTPTGGLPIYYDCYDAQLGQQWDLVLDNQAVRRVDVTFSARPYGSTPSTVTVTGTSSAGTRYATQAASSLQGSAGGLVTDLRVAGSDVTSSLIHASPAGRQVNLPSACTLNSGGFDFSSTPQIVDGSGTYTVWMSLSAVPSGTHTNTVQLYMQEFLSTGELVADGGLTGTFPIDNFTSARNGLLVALGQISLPLGQSLGGTRSYTALITITDENGATTNRVTPRDLLFLSTEGTTIYQDTAVPTVMAIVDAPNPATDLNVVYASFGTNTATWRAKTRPPRSTIVAGPPMQVHPQGNYLLAYTPRSTAPTITATYVPRWLSERTV